MNFWSNNKYHRTHQELLLLENLLFYDLQLYKVLLEKRHVNTLLQMLPWKMNSVQTEVSIVLLYFNIVFLSIS